MGLENTSEVDAVGIEETSGLCVLTIIDSLDWQEERSHLFMLQEKFNAYFGFVESNEIHEAYPASHGRGIAIELISRFSLPPSAIEFLSKASEVASQLNIAVRHRLISLE